MRVVKHTLYWIGVLTILTFVFGHKDRNYAQSFYFVSLLLPVIVGLNYFFNHFLVPQYLLKRKYWQLALYGFYTLVVSLYLEMLVVTVAFIILANYNYENLNPAATQVFLLCLVLYSVVFLNAFVLLVRRNFTGEQTIEQLKEDSARSAMKTLTVRADRKNHVIALSDIRYLESLSDYVRIHLVSGESLITKEKISRLEGKLPSHFMRIHRSFLVNNEKIVSYTGEAIYLEEEQLPVSRSYKKEVIDRLKKSTASEKPISISVHSQ